MAAIKEDKMMNDINVIMEIVKPFVKNNSSFDENTKIIEDQLIDSMNVLQVISEIERRFKIKIGPLDMVFDDFKSCQTITDKVSQLRK